MISLHNAPCSVRDSIQPTSPQTEHITSSPDTLQHRGLHWWIQILIYITFILVGQSIGVLLGRLYFNRGGKSRWISTLIQFVGFPVLLPLYHIFPKENTQRNKPLDLISFFMIASIYIVLGLFGAGASMMYSIGLQYMPISTFSLICASQLAFNALFSFFLNSQSFTPYIMNSLMLLTISSALLVFQPDHSSLPKGVSKANYVVGVLCAIGNAVGYGLLYSITEFVFQRILKNESFRATLDMMMYQSLVASCAAMAGLFISGEWKTLNGEMARFELGKISYMMTLIWTALGWQLYTIGLLGLIVKVSSLFSNVVSTFGLPIVPVLAVVFFHDAMDGIKVVAMLLAIWGFISYAYQQYLDDESKKSPNTYSSRDTESLRA